MYNIVQALCDSKGERGVTKFMVMLIEKKSLSDCLFQGTLNQVNMLPRMGMSALVLGLFSMELYDPGFKFFFKSGEE